MARIQFSMEIAVDQRQHIGRAAQIGAEFVSTSSNGTICPRDVEQFVRRVNSQIEA